MCRYMQFVERTILIQQDAMWVESTGASLNDFFVVVTDLWLKLGDVLYPFFSGFWEVQ